MSYKIIFTGKTTVETDQVKRNLAALHKVPMTQIDPLFSGRPIVIKENVDKATAQKILEIYTKAGAVCQIEHSDEDKTMICPKCGLEQPKAAACKKCGVIIDKYRPKPIPAPSTPQPPPQPELSNANKAKEAAEIAQKVLNTVTTKVKEQVNEAKKQRAESSAKYKTTYATTRSIARVCAGIGWTIVIIAIITTIKTVSDNPNSPLLYIAVGLLISVWGFLLILVGQVTRAIVDMADSNQEILIELRKKQDLSE